MKVDLSKGLVLLDRDGVLNEDRGDYVTTPEELLLLPAALRGVARLTAAGVSIGICTNQGGIARGRYDETALAAIHDKLLHHVRASGGEIARIVFCPFYDDDHPLRKPNPGMLLDQARYFALEDLAGVPFVGDNIIDIRAARAAGAVPVLVRTGKGMQVAKTQREELGAVAIYDDLEQAVAAWLDEGGRG